MGTRGQNLDCWSIELREISDHYHSSVGILSTHVPLSLSRAGTMLQRLLWLKNEFYHFYIKASFYIIFGKSIGKINRPNPTLSSGLAVTGFPLFGLLSGHLTFQHSSSSSISSFSVV